MPTALITGGHGGIGYSCARHLATAFRWDLVLAGRSAERMAPAAAELRALGVTVTLLTLDTSSLQSVRGAAATVKDLLARGEIASLDALLCNAGGRFDGPVDYSADGYELTFATNCLGHFLLVALLGDSVAHNGRIVFTASGTHDPATMDGRLVGPVVEPDAQLLAHTGKDGRPAIAVGKRYATSKLVNILNAYELHRRLRRDGSALASIAFDPGSVSDSGFLRGVPAPVRWLARSGVLNSLFRAIGITMGSLDFSGAALARLAADPAFAGASGTYMQSNDGKLSETRSSTLSYDESRAARLWQQMESLAGL